QRHPRLGGVPRAPDQGDGQTGGPGRRLTPAQREEWTPDKGFALSGVTAVINEQDCRPGSRAAAVRGPSMAEAAMPEGYFVYILASGKLGTLYTGVSNDLLRRTWEHREHVVEGF